MLLLVAYAINATFVHLVFSSNSDPEESWKWLDLMWKQVVLLLLMIISVRDLKDFQILSYTLLIGGTFIACEVYFFNAGSYHHGRLENLPLPSGGSSNFVSPVLSQSAIIGGFLVFFGKTKEKLFALFCCVMLTEAILQCL
ncbi:membrane protein, partial [Rhodopirellula maiorica SM1]